MTTVPAPTLIDQCPTCHGSAAKDERGNDHIVATIIHHQQVLGDPKRHEPAGILLQQRVCSECATGWWTRWAVAKGKAKLKSKTITEDIL